MLGRTGMMAAGMLALAAMDEWQPKKAGRYHDPNRSVTGAISQEERDRRNRLKKQAKQQKKRNR